MLSKTITALALVGAAVAMPQGTYQNQQDGYSTQPAGAQSYGAPQQSYGQQSLSEYTSAWQNTLPTSFGATYATTSAYTAPQESYSTPAAATTDVYSSQNVYTSPPAVYSTPATSAYMSSWASTPVQSGYMTPAPYPVPGSSAPAYGSGVAGSSGAVSSYPPMQTGAAPIATPLAGLIAGAFAVAMF